MDRNVVDATARWSLKGSILVITAGTGRGRLYRITDGSTSTVITYEPLRWWEWPVVKARMLWRRWWSKVKRWWNRIAP